MATKSQLEGDRKVPAGQSIFDNIYLLLAVGLAIPIVSYVVWSLIDLANVPAHP